MLVVVGVLGRQTELRQLEPRLVLGVPPQLDVDAAPGHVRRDRHRPRLTGFGNHLGLGRRPRVGCRDRVEHVMVDPPGAESLREQSGDLDGDRSDENRLAVGVALDDLAFDRRPLSVAGLVDLIVADPP